MHWRLPLPKFEPISKNDNLDHDMYEIFGTVQILA